MIGMSNRDPIPYGPPVHPVFTRKTFEPYDSTLFIKRSAYTPAGLGKKGAPKHVENVVPIDSVDPTSVEPTFAV